MTYPGDQAERLAELLPRSRVVKSFNVLSAYALESGGLQGSKEVPLAGDCPAARQAVAGNTALLSAPVFSCTAELVRRAGFTPLDRGGLAAARQIEDIPLSLFPAWRAPLYTHLALFTLLYLLSFARFQICWPLTWSSTFLWELWHHIPMVGSDNSSLLTERAGQHEQDAGGSLAGQPGALLPARRAGRLAADRPGHQVLSGSTPCHNSCHQTLTHLIISFTVTIL